MILDHLLRLRDGGTAPAVDAIETGMTSLTRDPATGQVVVPINKTPLRGLAMVVVHPADTNADNTLETLVVTIQASDAKYFTTTVATANAKLKFTSKQKGNPDISITFTVGTPLGVVVAGSDITVTFLTGATIASEVKTLIEADAAANALVSVSYPTGNDGTGVVGAFTVEQLWDTGAETVATFPAIAHTCSANLMVRRFHTQKKFIRSEIAWYSGDADLAFLDIFVGDMIPEED